MHGEGTRQLYIPWRYNQPILRTLRIKLERFLNYELVRHKLPIYHSPLQSALVRASSIDRGTLLLLVLLLRRFHLSRLRREPR